MPRPDEPLPTIPFRQALRIWIKVALLSFGGPAGQIAVMHRLLVEEKRWIGERRFLHALITPWSSPDRRRSSLPPTPAGCCTAPAAG